MGWVVTAGLFARRRRVAYDSAKDLALRVAAGQDVADSVFVHAVEERAKIIRVRLRVGRCNREQADEKTAEE